MDPISQQIHLIHDKVQQLAAQLDQQRRQYKALQEAHNELQAAHQLQANTIVELEDKLKTLQIAKGGAADHDKTALKLKINEYIREIDKCIAMLNT